MKGDLTRSQGCVQGLLEASDVDDWRPLDSPPKILRRSLRHLLKGQQNGECSGTRHLNLAHHEPTGYDE